MLTGDALRGYLEYLQSLGIDDVYRTSTEPDAEVGAVLSSLLAQDTTPAAPIPASIQTERPTRALSGKPPSAEVRSATSAAETAASPPNSPGLSTFTNNAGPVAGTTPHRESVERTAQADMAPTSFNNRAPLPTSFIEASLKASTLQALRGEIGDCTRCPLAYAGRHSIVFADGDPNARLMFVGEGPGADEDASGLPFVGKAGQLLNNMIAAMGLRREQVYIANVVMCRPPKNRTPEPVEANTCSQFLLRQIDVVRPEIIVALGSTAATYLLGVKQSLAALRGQWHDVRGARCAVTYHPAYLLRDPKMKGEAWKDLQRVMVELKLKAPSAGK